MVAPIVDTHINLAGHMAVDTGTARSAGSMPMMLRAVVARWQVTLPAHSITVGDELIAVRIMAVCAYHTRLMHFALNKRAVDIDFIAYLAIRPIKRIFDQGQPVGIQKRLARVVFSQRAASGMTTTAGIDLRCIGKRLIALSDARTL